MTKNFKYIYTKDIINSYVCAEKYHNFKNMTYIIG